MKKILIIGLTTLLLAACTKYEGPKRDTSAIMNFEPKTVPSAQGVYNNCIKETVEYIGAYTKVATAEELILRCKEQATKAKALTDTLNTFR